MRGFWVGRGGSELGLFSLGLPDVLAFDGDTGTVGFLLPIPSLGSVGGVVPNPDGSQFLVAGAGERSSVVNLATGRQAVLSPQPYSFTFGPMCWLPDGSAAAVSTSQNVGGPVQVYSRQGTLIAQLPTSHGPVTSVACSASASDQWLAAGDERGDVWLRLADGTVVPLYGHNSAVTAIASSPDGQYLATASRDGTARIWNAATGQLVTTLDDGDTPVTGIQFGASAGLALTVNSSGVLRVWDTGVGQPVTRLQRPARDLGVALGFTSDGRQVTGAGLVISTGADSRVTSADALTWDARTGGLVREVPLPGITDASPPCSQRLAKDSGVMFAPPSLSPSQCYVPPPPDLALAVPLTRPYPGVTGMITVMELLPLARSPDGRYTAYARSRSVALIGANGHEVATLPVGSAVAGLSFYNGATGLLAMTGTAIYLWNPLSGRPPLVIRVSAAPIDAKVSANGSRLAAASGDNSVSVWDTTSGKLIRSFRAARAYNVPLRVAIAGDGNIVAAGGSDGVVSFWNVATGKLVAADSLPHPPITDLSSTPDGARFLAADLPEVVSGPLPPGDGEVLDSASGKVLATYTSPENPGGIVYPDATLSADGGFLLAGITGLAPVPPGGFEAAYQVSTGQTMADLQAATEQTIGPYSEYPLRPWAPDGSEVLSGTAIYACDACGNTSALMASATSRIAWSRPLSATSEHPPATSPYS